MKRNGSSTWSNRARRGCRSTPPTGRPATPTSFTATTRTVTDADLRECCELQAVEVERGNVALVRTGNGGLWGDEERYLSGSGMARSWLADRDVLAVGADNMAWDVPGFKDPDLGCTLPGHVILLVRNGVYIIENLMLEELAGAGRHCFTFVCAPLKLVGATGSPVRQMAIVGDDTSSGEGG